MNITLEYFKNFFFPIQCLLCKRVGYWLCPCCENKLWPTLPECYLCRQISNNYSTHISCINNGAIFSRVVIGWQYNKDSRELIKALKYRKATDIVDYITHLYIKRLEEILGTSLRNNTDVLLIPIPSDALKLNQRGFNQSELIAIKLAEKLSLLYENQLLLREVSFGSQASRNMKKRKQSQNHFYINRNKLNLLDQISEIIIFDDVISTGTTLNHAAKLIKAVRPQLKLIGFSLFRGKPLRKKNAGN